MNGTFDVRTALERHLATCEANPDDGGDTSTDHLAWMCRTALSGIGTYPGDKVARWSGYVRGCLTFGGLLPVAQPSYPPPLPDPERPTLLHRAHRILFERYRDISEGNPEAGGAISNDGLALTCGDCLGLLGSRPVETLSEAMGFVQGILACKGLLDVREERNLSRPLFHAAYAEVGDVPPTLERTRGG